MSTLTQEQFSQIRDEIFRISSNENNPTGAINKLTSYIRKYSSSGDLYALRAVLHYDIQDGPLTISDTTTAFELGLLHFDIPEVRKALYYGRGLAYSNLGNSQNAISDASKAISVDPNYVNAYTMRGQAYADIEQYQPAMTDFDKALSIDPKDGFAYECRAGVWAAWGQHAKAKADYRKAESLGQRLHPEIKKYMRRGWFW